ALVKSQLPELPIATAIHPSAIIGSDVSIGAGTIVMAGSIVNPGCSIGKCCIVNTAASLDHDSTMHDYSSLAPGVVTGGNCTIGSYAAIGIGATLIHDVTIGEHTVVGAGATVTADIDPFAVAIGTPARVTRSRTAGSKYL
ncbi:MAG: acetyltransferase, partial [Rhodothermales bacterium]|nr:acetyltransferase [Rhodothermales bacterium]